MERLRLEHFNPHFYSQQARSARKAKAQADAAYREKRVRILLTVQKHVPRQEDLKARQNAVDALVDELMELGDK